MKRRVLSLFLTLAMSLTMLPAAALADYEPAADGGTQTDEITVLEKNENSYVTLSEEHTHEVNGQTVVFTPWTDKTKLPTEEGSYYLMEDVTLSTNWYVSGTVNLCLNGKTITMNKNTDAVSLRDNANTVFNLYDNEENEGKITHSEGQNGRGVIVYGTFNMYGGNITGNIANSTSPNGGGVEVFGTFNMYGGRITNNTARSDGGGVDVSRIGAFNMYGGTISGNSTQQHGGGVSTRSDNREKASFNMYGGTITNNTAVNGGGVYLNCNVPVSGTVKITDNYTGTLSDDGSITKDTVNNVDCNGWSFELNGLDSGTKIGVTRAIDDGKIDVAFAGNASEDDAQYFFADVSGSTIDYRDNKLYLTSHKWEYQHGVNFITAHCPECGRYDGGRLTLTVPDDFRYDGQPHPATVTEEDWLGEAYTLTYGTSEGADDLGTTAPTDAGTYWAGIEIGDAKIALSYTIEKAYLSVNDFECGNPNGLTYNGNVWPVSVTPANGINGVGEITIKCYRNGVPVDVNNVIYDGYYMVIIDVAEGKNYNEVNELMDTHWNFTINPKIVTDTIPFEDKTATYTGEPISNELETTLPEGVGTATYTYKGIGDTTYAESATAPTDAGTYEVTADFAKVDGYRKVNPKTAQLTINPAALTVTPNALSKTAGASDPELTYTVSGAQNGEIPAFEGTLSRAEGEAVGTYEIGLGTLALTDNEAFKAANYTLSLSTEPVYFTINVKPSNGGGSSGGSSSGSSSSSSASYKPSVTPSEDGTTTISNTSPKKGDTVTITPKPKDGNEVAKVIVTDKNGKTVEVKANADGTYSFVQPDSAVTIKVEYQPKQTGKNDFADVSADHFAYDAVKWAAEKDITGGIGDNKFAPNQYCTRAQIVTFLWRAAGSPEPKNASSFTDVAESSYYAKAVAWAIENGITSGAGDGQFAPDAACTRAQAVTFLARAVNAKADGAADFADVPADSYYASAVAWAVKNGITNGVGDGMFAPNDACTRAQIVTFLYRLYGGK